MRAHRLLLLALLGWLPATARGQEAQVDVAGTPAALILRLRGELTLTDSQVSRLQSLAKIQASALSRVTAAFLRAEADLIDAARGDDLVVRRTALEKRAKVAIDAEISRLKAEKESRAILTSDQLAALASIPTSRTDGRPERVNLWQPLVIPAPLTMIPSDVRDSAEVRISVVPNHAGIYIGGVKIGTGRKMLALPVGKHEITLHAAGCTDIIVSVSVTKGPPIIVPPQTLTCER